jgi:hypothetical protein
MPANVLSLPDKLSIEEEGQKCRGNSLSDLESKGRRTELWLTLKTRNAEYALVWPNITIKSEPPPVGTSYQRLRLCHAIDAAS